MPKGRILTPDERLVIVREAAKGADVKGLALRFGVTRRTIHYTNISPVSLRAIVQR